MFKVALENNEVLEIKTGSLASGLPLVLLSLCIFIVPELGYGIQRSAQSIGVATALLIVGTLVTIFSRKYFIRFSKKEDSLEIRSQNLYKKFSEKYSISNIQEVVLNREHDLGPEDISYQIILTVKDGAPLYLDKSGSSWTRTGGILTKFSEHDTSMPVAERIAQFLSIPLIKNF